MKVDRIANVFTVQHSDGITLKFSRLHEDSKGVVTAEVVVYDQQLQYPFVNRSRLNLLSIPAKEKLKKLLAELVPRIFNWYELIEASADAVMLRYRQGEPVFDLSEVPKSERLRLRLDPFLFEGQPNLIYGPGGVGKSAFANFLACIIQENVPVNGMTSEKGNVLYLDWETSKDEQRDRTAAIGEGLMLVDTPHIKYRFCTQSLKNDVEHISEIVAECETDILIIDSAAPACGGDPETAASALEFFTCLRELRCTSLIIAHETKNGDNTRGPFGSIFWWNMPRSIWQFKGAQATLDGDVEVGLIHRKSNNGRLHKPIGYRMEIENDDYGVPSAIRFENTDMRDNPELVAKLATREQIAYHLGKGAKSVNELSNLIDFPKDTLSRTLTRYRGKDFTQVGDGRWGLLKHEIM